MPSEKMIHVNASYCFLTAFNKPFDRGRLSIPISIVSVVHHQLGSRNIHGISTLYFLVPFAGISLIRFNGSRFRGLSLLDIQ